VGGADATSVAGFSFHPNNKIMVFSSIIFLFFFLPTVLLVYYLTPVRMTRVRNMLLVVGSLLFYIWGEVFNVFLLLGMLAVNYFAGTRIGCSPNRKIWLIAGVTSNLLVLFFYKYLSWVVSLLGLSFAPKITLPLGISFFTFHAISYLVDIYRKEIAPARGILDFSCYFVMFPHLVAGPIVRFAHVASALQSRQGGVDMFYNGICRFTIGLAKKVLIANQVAVIADAAFAVPPESLGTGAAWLGAVAYALQIYFDFSAYSDMAIGLAAMFGFQFHENFNYPYAADSMRDFWRRWHISLSSWLRDYLYIPLGGNRRGVFRSHFNLLLVFFCCGLWHGASWTFVLWGLYHGFFLVIERMGFERWLNAKANFSRHFYVVFVFINGWVLFRAETLSQAVAYWQNMFSFQTLELPVQIEYKLSPMFWLAFFAGIVGASGIPAKLWRKMEKLAVGKIQQAAFDSANLLFGISVGFLAIIFLLAGAFNPFLYFRF
jgi:alginate O-acetyltransferase complex protein AlgI